MNKKTDSYEIYIEDILHQVNKKDKRVCGDYFMCDRSPEATLSILCDGLGSGIKANLAAMMCASRLREAIRREGSLYKACRHVAASMHRARTEDIPFSAFTVANVLKDGQYTMLSYEMPPPALITKNQVYLPKQRFFSMGHEVVAEITGRLGMGEGLLLVSDGVTQAGMGHGKPYGWTVEAMADYADRLRRQGMSDARLAKSIFQEAGTFTDQGFHDDTTVAVLSCRRANVLNILTGPPSVRGLDETYVRQFAALEGAKVVCGSSTAQIVSRITGRTITAKQLSGSYSQPPMYSIEGFDLVTEGAVTLNQVYNILGEDPETFDEYSGVTDLCERMQEADVIRFYVGDAVNANHATISMKQVGVMPRSVIVSLLEEKLKQIGKVVCQVHW